MIGLVVDITERKLAEEASAREERFRVVLKNSPVVVFNQDRELRYTWLHNSRLGFTEAEVLGKTDADLFSAPSAGRLMQIKQQVLETGVGIRQEVTLHRDNHTLHLDLTVEPLRDARGNIVGITGAALDITLRKQALAALQESEERFQAFMNNSPTLAFMKDAAGRYVYVNGTQERQVGMDSAYQLGKTDFDLWPDEMARQLRRNDALVLSSGKPLELIETAPGTDETLRHYLVIKFPFRDRFGQQFLGGVAVDITERRQIEEAMNKQTERLQVLSRRWSRFRKKNATTSQRELHDEIGQALTSLGFTLKAIRKVSGEAACASLDEAQTLIEETLKQVRACRLIYGRRCSITWAC